MEGNIYMYLDQFKIHVCILYIYRTSFASYIHLLRERESPRLFVSSTYVYMYTGVNRERQRIKETCLVSHKET